ncbi:MAG: hypothetical protein DDT19_03014 [Syntrophomonadaceae bacterium]|nr:hypothetical protein [Bacillota bacterium]
MVPEVPAPAATVFQLAVTATSVFASLGTLMLRPLKTALVPTTGTVLPPRVRDKSETGLVTVIVASVMVNASLVAVKRYVAKATSVVPPTTIPGSAVAGASVTTSELGLIVMV